MTIETALVPDEKVVQFFRRAAEKLEARSPEDLAREEFEINQACIDYHNECAPRQAHALMRFADHRYIG